MIHAEDVNFSAKVASATRYEIIKICNKRVKIIVVSLIVRKSKQ